MEKFDYKKADKELYNPGRSPGVVEVPAMTFIMVDGSGDPNTAESYQQAIQLLYALSYAIKMSKKSGEAPAGYFEYVVPPLEGLWHIPGLNGMDYARKADFCWTSMIRQPEFVDDAVFARALQTATGKNPALDFSRARLSPFTEGLCVQCMHFGPYDDEPATIEQMDRYAAQNGYTLDFSDTRRHHEIYLGDPRRTAPDKLRTVLRHPVRKLADT